VPGTQIEARDLPEDIIRDTDIVRDASGSDIYDLAALGANQHE
jgi:hypothetical protein